MGVFPSVQPFFNRALYVPDVRMSDGVDVVNGHGRVQHFAVAERALRENGVAVLDDFLTPDALVLARELFADSTVWYGASAGGAVLKAQLKDGLHADLSLQLARELRELWLSSTLGRQPLLDVLAYKMEASAGSSGLAPHCEDGVIAMYVWVVDDLANTGGKNGLRVYNISVPADFTFKEAHGTDGSQSAVTNLLITRFASSVHVPYRANRAVFWHAPRVCKTEWDPSRWSKDYVHRRVEWVFRFGKSQVRGDRTERSGEYVPIFEGQEDSWGRHYYARDHDHR